MEILTYSKHLKYQARDLRKNMTSAEKMLWSKLRRRQICNTQFLRQKPIQSYIVDFYAKYPKLVIEIDGGIHNNPLINTADQDRDYVLATLGIMVLRFSNDQILFDLPFVLSKIRDQIIYEINKNI